MLKGNQKTTGWTGGSECAERTTTRPFCLIGSLGLKFGQGTTYLRSPECEGRTITTRSDKRGWTCWRDKNQQNQSSDRSLKCAGRSTNKLRVGKESSMWRRIINKPRFYQQTTVRRNLQLTRNKSKCSESIL